jgi:hypothetical protein
MRIKALSLGLSARLITAILVKVHARLHQPPMFSTGQEPINVIVFRYAARTHESCTTQG